MLSVRRRGGAAGVSRKSPVFMDGEGWRSSKSAKSLRASSSLGVVARRGEGVAWAEADAELHSG